MQPGLSVKYALWLLTTAEVKLSQKRHGIQPEKLKTGIIWSLTECLLTLVLHQCSSICPRGTHFPTEISRYDFFKESEPFSSLPLILV